MISGFINDIKCNTHAEEVQEEGTENVSSETFNFLTKEKRSAYKGKVLANVDQMDNDLVFKLYNQLAFKLKEKLKENQVEPELI